MGAGLFRDKVPPTVRVSCGKALFSVSPQFKTWGVGLLQEPVYGLGDFTNSDARNTVDRFGFVRMGMVEDMLTLKSTTSELLDLVLPVHHFFQGVASSICTLADDTLTPDLCF